MKHNGYRELLFLAAQSALRSDKDQDSGGSEHVHCFRAYSLSFGSPTTIISEGAHAEALELAPEPTAGASPHGSERIEFRVTTTGVWPKVRHWFDDSRFGGYEQRMLAWRVHLAVRWEIAGYDACTCISVPARGVVAGRPRLTARIPDKTEDLALMRRVLLAFTFLAIGIAALLAMAAMLFVVPFAWGIPNACIVFVFGNLAAAAVFACLYVLDGPDDRAVMGIRNLTPAGMGLVAVTGNALALFAILAPPDFAILSFSPRLMAVLLGLPVFLAGWLILASLGVRIWKSRQG